MGFQGKGSNQKQVSTLVCVFRGSHKFCYFFSPFYRFVQALSLLLPGHFIFYAHPRKKHMFQGLKSRSGPGQSFAGVLAWMATFVLKSAPLISRLCYIAWQEGRDVFSGAHFWGFIGTYLWLLFWMNDAMSASSYAGVCRLYAVCLIPGLSTVYGMLHV